MNTKQLLWMTGLAALWLAGCAVSPSAPAEASAVSRPWVSADRQWRQLLDVWLRDTFVTLAPDGNYYLTGTIADDALGHCWATNAGIPLWRSPDLTNWTSLGLVWTFERDGAWENQLKPVPKNHWEFARKDEWGRPVPPVRRAIWAPELQYVHGNYYLTATLNWAPPDRGTILLRSSTRRPEGPYTNVADKVMTDEIDSSLFVDEDGSVYYVWQDGKIARMNREMTALAEAPRRLLQTAWQPEPYLEGAFLFKHDGRYHLALAAWEFRHRTTGEFRHHVAPEGRGPYEQWNYDCAVASATDLNGQFGDRYIALPGGGHNNFFQDKAGRWWATWFGNPRAMKPGPFAACRPVIVPMVYAEGRFRVETDFD